MRIFGFAAGLTICAVAATLVGCVLGSESPDSGPHLSAAPGRFVFVSYEPNEAEPRDPYLYPGLRTAEADGSSDRALLTPLAHTTTKQTPCVRSSGHPERESAEPEWSPDGTRIAFSLEEKCPRVVYGHFSIWTIKSDGTKLRRLTAPSTTASYESPTWSPGGRQIAFVRVARRDAWGGIEVINADGTRRRRLTRRRLAQAPAWSPDGGRIAFEGENRTIFVLELRDGGVRRLTATESGSLDWSPDGRHIAYVVMSSPESDTGDIFVFDLREGEAKRLTDTGFVQVSGGLDWSPDGRRIAYANNDAVGVINADGSDDRILSSHEAGAECPVWSADAEHVAYSGGSVTRLEAGEAEWGVYVVAADGIGHPRLILRYNSCVDWAAKVRK